MARRKAGDKQIRVGNVSRVSGKVIVAGGDVYEGVTLEQVSLFLEQFTTKYQRKTFDGRCPFKGLEVFEEEDADLFFGRKRLVEDLVSRVKESRAVFITGPSGSGKSSLVRAGLIHALRNGAIRNSRNWRYEIIKPGREPLKDLSLAFSRLKSPELADYFQAHVIETDILHRCAESVLSGRKDQRFVLFVDQFEEAFTQVNNESERHAFLEMLAHAGTVENGRVIVLFAMRSDFLSNCAAYPAINELLSQQFRQIGAMQPEELVSAIALPAKEVGLPIEAELVTQIINDMKGEPGALPLMQFALQELFEARQVKGKDIALTLEDYLERGGIQKILARHADETFNKLSTDQQELARSIFSGLIEIGKGRQDTRRTALFDELIPANTSATEVEAVVQKLADARLIITDEQAGKDTLTISHEKLIDAWPWLRRVIEENRETIAFQNLLNSDAEEWSDNKRDKSYLYRGKRLAKARKQLASQDVMLNKVAKDFVRKSIAQQRLALITPLAFLTLIAIPILSFVYIVVSDFTVGARVNATMANFISTLSPAQRLHDLATLYREKGILSNTDSSLQAMQLFYGLSAKDQLALFNADVILQNPSLRNDLVVVVSKLYITMANVDPKSDNSALLIAMGDALETGKDNALVQLLAQEIKAWLTGREWAQKGDFQSALASYDQAILLNSSNAASLYERAKIYISLGNYSNALQDLEAVISIAKQSAPEVPATVTPEANSLPSNTSTNIVQVNNPKVITNSPTLAVTPFTVTLQVQKINPTTEAVVRYDSNFTTLIDVINAVREVIDSTPGLQTAILSNVHEYPNLQAFGLIANPSRPAISTDTPTGNP